ncbi:MAG: hypothetical protein HYY24_20420 [Verrucomicrobia bacterium]|nr:hypothetical protein [Verrucomicrobiota bacterium]
MNLLQQLQGAVESATTNLRSKRAAAERDAAAAAAEAGELQALAQRYQELFANVEAANVRAANCIAAFESYTEGARAAALSNLVVGWEAGNWPSSLADLARATAAETNREAIVAAFHQRAALYEAQLTEFLDKHRPALQRLGVL